MRLSITYNELERFLTKEDRKDIEEMNSPSFEQSKMVKTRWDSFYGNDPVKFGSGLGAVKPLLKAYIKCKHTHPELFL